MKFTLDLAVAFTLTPTLARILTLTLCRHTHTHTQHTHTHIPTDRPTRIQRRLRGGAPHDTPSLEPCDSPGLTRRVRGPACALVEPGHWVMVGPDLDRHRQEAPVLEFHRNTPSATASTIPLTSTPPVFLNTTRMCCRFTYTHTYSLKSQPTKHNRKHNPVFLNTNDMCYGCSYTHTYSLNPPSATASTIECHLPAQPGVFKHHRYVLRLLQIHTHLLSQPAKRSRKHNTTYSKI